MCEGKEPRQILESTVETRHNHLFPNLFCTNIAALIPPYTICSFLLMTIIQTINGPGSSVGIATELRVGRSWMESRWGRDVPPVQTDPGAHLVSCKMGTVSFPGLKCGRVVLLTTHPLLVPHSWKSRAIPLPILWATPGL